MRVIKIGGRVQGNPGVYAALADSWLSRPGAIVLVHGGGDEVSSLQRLMGIEPVFIGGRRVTSEADIDVLRMGLSGASNKRVVAQLQNRGVRAIGVSGEDGDLIGAHPVVEVQLGQVGKPTEINVALIDVLLKSGYLPVISPLGRSVLDGMPLNINGDDAAAAIAGALQADELLLIADVEGVLLDGCVVPHLTAEKANEFVASGSATGGMVAKLDAALHCLTLGAARVRIGGIAMIEDTNAGTTITLSQSMV